MEKVTNLVDDIASIELHNGVVRIAFFRLLPDRKTEIVLELKIPQNQATSLILERNFINNYSDSFYKGIQTCIRPHLTK
jgi:hypothetical protein